MVNAAWLFYCHVIATSHCCSNSTYNSELSDRKRAEHKAVNWQVGKNRQQVEGQANTVLMELIVDVVREVTLCGPQGVDSRPDLPILHPAQPLSCCNYLSQCERVCVCVCFRGRGVVGDGTCTWPNMQTNPVFPINDVKKAPAAAHTYLRPWLPWPSPFLAPGNYLWAYGGVGTIVCCLRSTQGDVGLMRIQRPLWLGLTAPSFAWGDGAFISYSSKTSGAEHTYLHTWTHTLNTHARKG